MIEPANLPIKDGALPDLRRQGPLVHLTLIDKSGMVWINTKDITAMRRVSALDPLNGVKHWTRIYLGSGSTWEVTEEASRIVAAMPDE